MDSSSAPRLDRLTLRPATPADVPTILRFIHELAAYERAPEQVIATEADLLRDGWGLAADGLTPLQPTAPPRFRAIIADWLSDPTTQPEPAGFALYFTSYSTWLGHHGIRLEDLYVTPHLRGHGIGKALLRALAQIAVAEGCDRLEWDVLTWNTPAIAVYERIGGKTQEEWRIMRLSGDRLTTFAAEQDPSQG